MNNILETQKLGQSIWYDNISRSMFSSGSLAKMINEGLLGMTSNPAIFEKAIAGSSDYDEQLGTLADSGNPKELFEALAISDIQSACDLFKPVFDKTERGDGYVSLEVSPYLAHDSEGTIAEGRRLFKAVARPNLMIKVPATKEGMPAITALLADGINVNVTLLFAQDAYEATAAAHLEGLEKFAAAGGDLKTVHSVASFFLSRIDTLIDPKLPEGAPLKGKVAIACAKIAYESYQKMIAGARWKALAAKGASPQRLLWASTSTKNPAYSPTMYVDALIGPDTVNTVPGETYDAFKASGHVAATLTQGLDQAKATLKDLAAAGIALKEVTDTLIREGLEKFAQPFDKLLSAVEKKRQSLLGSRLNRQTLQLGEHAGEIEKLADEWMAKGNIRRLWAHDKTLWTNADEDKWLGWLDIVAAQQMSLASFDKLANDARAYDFAVVLGMGGSSLCPWVLEQTFGRTKGAPQLLVLDSTSPIQIEALQKKIALTKTLFIVSSKSGSTTEPNVLMAHFRELLRAAGVQKPESHFVAVTDPDSSLEKAATRDGFYFVAGGVPSIGGRYSALSNFGLVPAAIMGLDIKSLLSSTALMVQACSAFTPAAQNPGVMLGLALGVWQKHGRDKVTFVTSPKLRALGAWFEQLIAESTGKKGKGIVPIDGETLAAPSAYGSDRVFVYLHDHKEDAAQVAALNALEKAGHPSVRISLESAQSVAQEFFRWEIATAVAGAIIGINPFDQPDVEAAKIATKRLLEKGTDTKQDKPLAENDDLQLFGDPGLQAGKVEEVLAAHLRRLVNNDYFAVNAFIAMSDANISELEALRLAVRDNKHVATTLGFGPRFLHSTGQLHKGGANNGVFLEVTADDGADVAIPGMKAGFRELLQAQALGDAEVLLERKRRVLRVKLRSSDKLPAFKKLILAAVK